MFTVHIHLQQTFITCTCSSIQSYNRRLSAYHTQGSPMDIIWGNYCKLAHKTLLLFVCPKIWHMYMYTVPTKLKNIPVIIWYNLQKIAFLIIVHQWESQDSVENELLLSMTNGLWQCWITFFFLSNCNTLSLHGGENTCMRKMQHLEISLCDKSW